MKKFMLIVMLLLISIMSQGVLADWVIEDDLVYVNDSNAYISAEPHTIINSGYVTFTVVPKTYTGDVNVIWGFNTSITKPTSVDLYNPHNVTTEHNFTCDPPYWYNYTINPNYAWCWHNITNNVTGEPETILIFEHDFDWANIGINTIYWNETVVEDWVDFADHVNMINYDFNGKNKWYYASDLPVVAGNSYMVRAYVEVLFAGNEPSSGKYDFAVYPSIYGWDIGQAIANNHFYYLDPWWGSDITDSLISYYEFQNNASDIHGSNDGTLNGPTYGAGFGKLGGAYSFDNTNDEITFASDWTTQNQQNNMSMSFWLNLTNKDNEHVICQRAVAQAGNWKIGVFSDKVRFYYWTSSADNSVEIGITSASLNTDTLYHVVITYNEETNTAIFYIDNVSESIVLSGDTASSIDRTIGNNGADTNWLGGIVDEVGIWDRVLTASEVEGLWNGGAGFAYSSFVSSVETLVVTLSKPDNDTTLFYKDNPFTFNFTVVDSDNATLNCSLYIDDVLNVTNATTDNNTLTNFVINVSKGSHTWNVTCNDGTNFNSSERTFTVNNTAPNATLNNPTSGATDQPISVILNMTYIDDDLDVGNVTFFNNDTGLQLGNNTGLSNGSIANITWSGLNYTATYYWYVNITDGNLTTTSTVWNFTTRGANAPTVTLVSPGDTSVDIDITPSLQVNYTDSDGDSATLTFINDVTGATICTNTGVTNGSISTCVWVGRSVDTVYTWRVFANDSINTTNSSTYSFTTRSQFIGGGGSSATPSEPEGLGKTVCAVFVTPNSAFITNDVLIVSLSIFNQESEDYTATMAFRDASGELSIIDYLKVTDVGVVLGYDDATIQVSYKKPMLGIISALGVAELVLISERCTDIVVPIAMNVTSTSLITELFGDRKLESWGALITEPLNPNLPWLRVWMLLVLFGALFGGILVDKTLVKSSESLDWFAKIISWLVLTSIAILATIYILNLII